VIEREAQSLVCEAVAGPVAGGAEARGEIRHCRIGGVAAQIFRTAHELDAEVIVMGTRGLTEFPALAIGSLTHTVLHVADLPVLLVR
jgi:nucleotide-binding universal stress UspA family protein